MDEVGFGTVVATPMGLAVRRRNGPSNKVLTLTDGGGTT
jgi:hypothetical protein